VTWVRSSAPRRSLAALVVGLLATLASPGLVAAKGGPKGQSAGEPTGGSTASCSAMSGTTSLAALANAIGVDRWRNGSSALTGAGIDVAVIDTGVNPLAIDVVDGPDLSFDGLRDNLRHRDLHGHGTNMAAIIAGDDGIAPSSRIVNVKVGAGNGAVDVSQVIAGIDWAVQNRNAQGMNIRVINLAFDSDADVDYRTDPLTRAVENAWFHGIVVVAAGGNDGRSVKRLGNPALDPFVIAVGAAERDGGSRTGWRVPQWSSTGDGTRNPDLVAPGSAVLSTGVAGSHLADTYPAATCLDGAGRLQLRGSGTSQAAAVVSGAVALLLQQRPSLGPDQVKALLTDTATTVLDDRGKPRPPEQQGHGLINLGAALAAPTPSATLVRQTFLPGTGLGTLEASRGSYHVGSDGDQLTGEVTAFGGAWNPAAHSLAQATDTSWTDQRWTGSTWSSGTWSGSTWSGSTWSGAAWSGSTWSGSTWSGSTWSGSTWSGSTWSGSTWSGSTWSGSTWS
jgi:serine protease AprX